MPYSDHPGEPDHLTVHPMDHPLSGRAVGNTREDGLRRLSTLTVTAAVAAVTATSVVAVAAYHASNPSTPTPTSAGAAGTVEDSTNGGDQLRGPAQVPRRDNRPPAGVSSGS